MGGKFHLKLNNVEVGLQPALDLRVGNLHVHMILSNDVGIVSVQATMKSFDRGDLDRLHPREPAEMLDVCVRGSPSPSMSERVRLARVRDLPVPATAHERLRA